MMQKMCPEPRAEPASQTNRRRADRCYAMRPPSPITEDTILNDGCLLEPGHTEPHINRFADEWPIAAPPASAEPGCPDCSGGTELVMNGTCIRHGPLPEPRAEPADDLVARLDKALSYIDDARGWRDDGMQGAGLQIIEAEKEIEVCSREAANALRQRDARIKQLENGYDELRTACNRSRKREAELRADAERYRWLRDTIHDDDWWFRLGQTENDEAWDAMIDAARAAESTPDKGEA